MQHLEVRTHAPDESIRNERFFAHHMRANDGLPTSSSSECAEATEDARCSAVAEVLGLAVLALECATARKHAADFLTDETEPQPSFR